MDLLAELIGQAPGIVELREQVRQIVGRASAARRAPPILLLGETGTGKNLVAGLIHRAGPRRAGPFVDVNCAAIPEGLLEAELFGFERGAFTDARQAKPGLFQKADGGTLFLDEIGLLPDALQAKLLHAIEERTVRRLGSTRSEPVDVAIIAATNEDLDAAVHGRRFRQDLYHRLAVVTLRVPPLRERPDDVALLAEHFLQRACEDYGLRPRTLAPATMMALRKYAWPGNVRELANTMERVALLTDSARILPQMLDLPSGAASETPVPAAPLDERVETWERQELLKALEATRWNVVRAAARLGLTRGTIRYKLDKYGLEPRQQRSSRRRLVSPPASPPAEPPAPAVPTATRWGRRLVALLQVRIPAPGADLGRDFDTVVQKVESFGGRVEEAGASRLVAAFGLDPAEDAPRRAALAAMAIRNSRGSAGPRLAVTIAVHAEECPVGHVSRRPEIDADARRRMTLVLDELGAGAEPDAVLVSDAARSLLARRFEFDGPRLVGYGQDRFGPESHPAPFVGREQELDTLHARWRPAREGRGQMVALVGEPGIGKSRLLFEFRRSLADAPLIYLEGRGESFGGGVPYLPVVDLLRRFFAIQEADDPTTIGETVRGRLLALDPSLAPELSPILALLHAPGTEPEWQALDPAHRRQRTLDALRRLVLRVSQAQPVLLALEDLHWIDAESQAFLDRLVVSLPAARVLVVVTCRPEYRHAVGSQAPYTQVHLDPLAPASAEALVRSLLGEHDGLGPLARLLIERTDGNPFFLEETVRALVETGGLVGERGAYRAATRLEALHVPPTVRAVLAARIDRLAPDNHDVIQAAAVIGKDFPFALLLAVADVPEATLRLALDDLQAAELLYETRLTPDVEYTFKHALTHEVTYGTLAPERRQALHARVVEALERTPADRLPEQVERLAHHARAAALWPRAFDYGRQAGARAAWRSAHREAVQYFEHALEAARRLPETRATREQTLDLHLQIRWSLVPLGDYHRLADSLRSAAALAEGLDDPLRLGEISQSMTNFLRLVGDCDGALAAGERARAIGAELGQRTLEIRATYQLALVHRQLGRYEQAIGALQAVIDALQGDLLYERFGEPSVLSVHARGWLATALSDVGRFDEAIPLAEEAIQIAVAARNTFSETSARLALGTALARQGNLERALPLLERSQALARDGNFQLLVPLTASALGAALLRAERVDEALPLLELAVTTAFARGLVGGRSLYQVRLGQGMLRAGRAREAGDLAQQALDTARTHRERAHEAWALHLLADVAREDSTDPAAADQHDREAQALAETLGIQPLVDLCRERASPLQ
jgi:transcriptional regulator with AAA-type ATPase domain/tetratricopeptide (TPR) repeat protein